MRAHGLGRKDCSVCVGGMMGGEAGKVGLGWAMKGPGHLGFILESMRHWGGF